MLLVNTQGNLHGERKVALEETSYFPVVNLQHPVSKIY